MFDIRHAIITHADYPPTNCGPRLHWRDAAIVLALFAAVACSGGDAVVGPDASATGPGDNPPSTQAPAVNPLAGAAFYHDPNSNARRQADIWQSVRPADAQQMEKIAARPQAKWFGEWISNLTSAVTGVLSAAASQRATAVLVTYNIPARDCGSYSAGGLSSPEAYKSWISEFASALGGTRAAVILEPDALAGMDCLSAAQRDARLDLLRYAVTAFKARPNVAVYLDAGNARWHSPGEIARRLKLAGVDVADGFALNVSNFLTTAASTDYGVAVSSLVGGKHFVLDTSRNGLGPTANLDWCNPPGRGLGVAPTSMTGHPVVDAYLWVKPPGESDGECNGGPPPGVWWADYALGLAQRS